MERAARRPVDQARRLARDRAQPLLVDRSIRGRLSISPIVYGWRGAAKIVCTSPSLDDLAGVHDHHAVGHLGDQAEVVGDQDRSPRCVSSCAVFSTSRIWAWIVTSSAVVGSSAIRSFGCSRSPSRSSRAGASRPRTRADTGRTRRSGFGTPTIFSSSIDRARAALSLDVLLCARIASAIWCADLEDRVQRGHRVLEDHRHVAAAQPSQLLLGSFSRSRPSKIGLAAVDPPGRLRDQSEDGQRLTLLPGAGLADDAERLARIDVVA